MELTVHKIGHSERQAHLAIVELDRRPLWASEPKDMGCDGERVRAAGRGTDAGIAVVSEKELVAATVVVPDTIRSAGAVRLLAAYVTKYFDVSVEARGQVRTVTVSRRQRPELEKALTAIARCFC